jgi:hypothetical protein
MLVAQPPGVELLPEAPPWAGSVMPSNLLARCCFPTTSSPDDGPCSLDGDQIHVLDPNLLASVHHPLLPHLSLAQFLVEEAGQRED